MRECACHACVKAREEANPGPKMFGRPVAFMVMFLCPTCGNKRCPGAVDHRRTCSGSNEPGQPGSFYELAPVASERSEESSPRQVLPPPRDELLPPSDRKGGER